MSKLITDNWLPVNFEAVFTQISTSGKKVKTAETLAQGKFPVVDQGRTFISGYLNDETLVISDESPLIIFGDHTREIKWIDFAFIPGADGVKILKPNPEMNGRFLYFFLLNFPIESKGYARHFKILKDAEYQVPPLVEQTHITQKLDELLAQVDTLKARIDAIPALLKRFRQSTLAAAVSGRLTEDWRPDNPMTESAEEYLQGVIRNRRQKPIVKFKEPALPDLEKRNIETLEGWIITSVSSFAECLDSMRIPVKKELRNSKEGKYPYFGANGEVDRVDEYIFDDDLVLVTEDETFYGREKPIAYKYSGKCWANNHVHVLRAHDTVARNYLCFALMHYDVTPWLTGTTGRAKLTQGALLSLPILVPPAAEQTEIVRRVEQLFAFADNLEAKVASAKSRIDHLTQSILAKAFRGELVPQDPNDEPASVLLERIKAQRAAAPKAKRSRKTSA